MPKMWEGKRRTSHIRRQVTQSIFRAFDYAKARGTPLNLYVVINLHETPTASAATIFERIRHKYRDWLNYRTKPSLGGPLPPLYIYAMENPSGDHHHVNWAVYIPPGYQAEFERKLTRWIEKAQGVCGPRDGLVQPINPDFDKRLAKYIVKGTDPAFIEHFYLAEMATPQGEIWGKRAGVSPALGHSARQASGFRPRRYGAWQMAA